MEKEGTKTKRVRYGKGVYDIKMEIYRKKRTIE